MARRIGRPTPAMAVAVVALFVALGGSVYAAAGIDGRTIKPKSLPGNRLVPGSVAASRLAPGTIPGGRLTPQSVTGVQVDSGTLGQVPSATHAQQADSAREAGKALYAASSGDAASVNGHVAGCPAATRAFAGSCWERTYSDAAVEAADAAAECAKKGGELPFALAFAAFAKQADVGIAADGEWSSDIPGFTGPEIYEVAFVSPGPVVDATAHEELKKYRCVLPLLS